MTPPAAFPMPKLGLTMTEGMVAEWRLRPGDRFAAGDVVVVIETEKIANEIEAPSAGRLDEILVPEGETVAVGTAIARWSLDGAGAAALPRPGEAPKTPQRKTQPAAPKPADRRVRATPLARRLARERGVDLEALTPSGPRGRVKASDVEAAATTPIAAPAARPAGSYRRAMARRLAEVKPGVPHFYLANEARAERLLDLRAQLNAPSERPRLSLTHLILAAAARALAEVPAANQVWRDNALAAFDGVDIALAVNTQAGLMVPVLRDLGTDDPYTVRAKAEPLIRRARGGALTADDVGGGALTVSNAGMYDVTYMTSIITPGQSSILAVGAVREVFRPDAHGRPELRREIGLVLSCDHRVLDGVLGLKLLNRIKAYIERPVGLLLPTTADRSA
jgi:pyruvate dehydrogenase E2 component (dihydrolipoyllysine-residue acetyltransferase)